MNWAWEHRSLLLDLATEHMYLAFAPVAIGILLGLPLGLSAHRTPGLRRPLRVVAGVLLAVPSIALFVVLPGLLGTEIAARVNMIVALSLFVLAVVFRSVLDGLATVPPHVRQAAVAMGYSRGALLRRVELPIAGPTVIAGLRKASVACVALVCLGAIIGFGGLGQLFTDGFLRHYETEVLVGAALTVALAVGADQFFVRLQKVLFPWARLVPVR